ncbi:MAG: C40 family peptidase [Fimbriimonadaceae bacterium]
MIKTVFVAGAVMASMLVIAQDKVTVGKLGQTVKPVKITSKPGGGRTYYACKPYEYLVLTATNDNYYRVLLQNGASGYVQTASVAALPYDVTRPKKTTLASRSASSYRLPTTNRGAAATEGLKYPGTPYKWGGNDPNNGIDCSAFVKYLYGKIGLNLPRTAREQALVGKEISRLEDLQQGDRLYFWDSKRGRIGHTGLYLGNGYFVHSSSNNGGVSTDYLGSKKWLGMLVSARR